nr:Neurofilament medium polypeptide like [Ipomoea batatas]
MATKSDFAHKLLHDLRGRKEQMDTGKTHSGNQPDANAEIGRFSRGSQQIKAMESDGSEIGNSQRSSISNRSFHMQESSGEVAKMNCSGNNPMLSFLQRLTSFQKHYHPSNDHQVGKELLKGAMDLEESLRMLVNLQEASECMMSPERKNQIMLIEDDREDTAAKVANQKHSRDLPRFSFDVETEMRQQETDNRNEKQPSQTSDLVSHRRSSSCTDFTAQSTKLELKNQTKGRLSSVIAKLMGLDELPQIADAKALRRHSTSNKSKEGPVLKKIANSVSPTNADSVNEKNMQSKNAKPTQETVQIENETSDRLLLNNQQKPKDIIEVAGDNNQANRKEQHLSKQKSQVNKHKGRQAEATIPQTVRNKAPSLLEKRFPVNQTPHGKTNGTKSTAGMPQKSLPNSAYTEAPAKDGPAVTMGSSGNRNMNQIGLPKKLSSRTREGIGTYTFARKKPIKVPSAEKKENYFQIHRKREFRKIDGSSRKGTPQHTERSPGKQTAIFKATDQLRRDMAKHTGIEGKLSQDKPKEAKQNTTTIHKSEVSSKPLSSAQELQAETKDSIYIAGENDCQNPEYQKILPNHSSTGSYYPNNKNCQVFQDEQGRFVPTKLPENKNGLTEPEKHLKELLVTSQQFLNTIEAFFKLNIPTSTLQTNDPNSKSSEFNLKLHCSYEVVKRKARRRRLLSHPYAKTSIGCIKVRSLDDLVKQLCKGFDVLNSYWSKGKENCHTAADYLHTMVEKDIQNINPDLNSMWDIGWDTMMSTSQEKDEIIKDVERHLLNGLLDEITLDLLQITVSA